MTHRGKALETRVRTNQLLPSPRGAGRPEEARDEISLETLQANSLGRMNPKPTERETLVEDGGRGDLGWLEGSDEK